MALDTYTNLKTAIAAQLQRGDLTTEIDDFIDLAEAEFNSDLRLEEMKAEATITTSSTTALATLPTDFLEMSNLSFDGDPRLITYVTKKQLRDTRSGQASRAGRPSVYTLIGSSTSGGAKRLEFGNNPDGASTLTAEYYQTITALSTANPSNWLLAKRPAAYLYGAKKHGLIFTQDFDSLAQTESIFNRIMADLNNVNEQARGGGAGMQIFTDTGNP